MTWWLNWGEISRGPTQGGLSLVWSWGGPSEMKTLWLGRRSETGEGAWWELSWLQSNILTADVRNRRSTGVKCLVHHLLIRPPRPGCMFTHVCMHVVNSSTFASCQDTASATAEMPEDSSFFQKLNYANSSTCASCQDTAPATAEKAEDSEIYH